MDIITHRRNLHQIPELEMHLPETMAYLAKALSAFSCRVFSPMDSALCAYFDFGKPQTLAFRADCDGLPIAEKTGLPFASQKAGCMHACGHDGHMAILLELARRLNEKADLPHNVLLVFQPGEESPGGAAPLCATDIFETYRVKAIFALHLWPELEAGKVFTRSGPVMSHACEVNVDIQGKSAHIAKEHLGIDALAGGFAFYQKARALYHSLPEDVFRVLNFGRMESGQVRNAISEHTRMEGSLRAYDEETFRYLRQGLDSIAAQVQKETGTAVTVTYHDGYPAVVNPPELVEQVAGIAPLSLLEAPMTPAEDFSHYQKKLPGLFCFLGLGDVPALHSDTFAFDEEILQKGADFFEVLAERFL